MGKAAFCFHPAPALAKGGASLLLVLAACSPILAPPAPAPAQTAAGLPTWTPVAAATPQPTPFVPAFTTVEQGAVLGDQPAEPVYAAAATTQEWEALGSRLPGRAYTAGLEALQAGEVVVLAAFSGVRSSSGYMVEIQSVRPEGNRWIVVVAEIQPAPGTIVEPARTLPYHIASLPQSAFPQERSLEIIFQDPQGNLLGRQELSLPAP